MQNDLSNASPAPFSPENHAEIDAAAQRLGLRSVRAWVPNNHGKSRSAGAERTKRSRKKAEQQGLKQLSVSLPTNLHEPVKALAARIRAGEPAAEVWADLSPAQAQALNPPGPPNPPIPPGPPTPPSPPPAQAKPRGWRRWLLRWLLPSELRALID